MEDRAPSTVIDRAFVKRLTYGTPGQRREAERILDELGQSGLEALLQCIRQEEARRERRRVVLGSLLVICVVVSLAGSLWTLHTTGHFPAGFLGGLVCFSAIARFSATQRGATLALARYDDVRAVGPFVAALNADGELHHAVEAGLITLLPRMQASDAHYLNEHQRMELNKTLDRKFANPDLIKAILLAWQQVGDEKAMPYVENLSRNEKRSEDIRQAARDCLPFLQQSAAGIRMASTLLRASDGGAAHPEELLRAATADVTACPAELLRASDARAASPDLSIYHTAEEPQHVDARSV